MSIELIAVDLYIKFLTVHIDILLQPQHRKLFPSLNET